MIERESLEEEIMQKYPKVLEVLLSKERTLLSKERTAIAIAQLALGIAALGFLIIRFFADVEYEWFLPIGVGFVAVSLWMFYHSFREYHHFQKKLTHLHQKRGHLDKVYIHDFDD